MLVERAYDPADLLIMDYQDRFQEEVDLMVHDHDVRVAFDTPWARTFVDDETGEVMGCLGVVDQTNECWAVVSNRLIEKDTSPAMKVGLLRKSLAVLKMREESLGHGCWAHADDGRDAKFLMTMGFRYSHGEFYVLGNAEVPDEEWTDV